MSHARRIGDEDGQFDMAEESKSESNEPLTQKRDLLDAVMASSVPISLTRLSDGRLIGINEAWMDLTGYSRDEAIGRTTMDLGFWCDPGDAVVVRRTIFSHGAVRNLVCRFKTRSNAVVTCQLSAEMVEIEREPCVLALLVDVTERNRTEAELRRRNRELTLLNRIMMAASEEDPHPVLELACREIALAFDLPQGSAFAISEDGKIATVVAEYAAPGTSILGYSVPLSGNPLVDLLLRQKGPFVSEDSRVDPRLASLREMLCARNAVSVIGLPLVMDEDVIGCLSFSTPERRVFTSEELRLAWNVAGQVAAALARARLSETRRRLMTAIEWAPDSVIITDPHGHITYVNPAFERITGFSRYEVLRLTPALLKSGRHDAAFYRDLWSTISEGKVWNGRLINRKRDGTLYTEEAAIIPVGDRQGTILNYVAIKRDITERIESEEALRRSEERYRELVESAPLGIVSIGRNGNVISANSRMVSLMGAPSVDALRKVNVFSSLPPIEDDIRANLRNCFATGESGVFEAFHRSTWGKETYLRYHLTPLRNDSGETVGLQAILEDFTDTRRLQVQLAQAQKMEAIGTLAGGIAHDFNNILSAILGYAELARLSLKGNRDAEGSLRECVRAAERARNLVHQIFMFSRQGRQESRPIDIAAVVKEVAAFLRASLPSTIEMSVSTEPGLGFVETDPTYVHQILMNLCTNARDAMQETGGVLELSCIGVEVQKDDRPGCREIEPGTYLRLRVRDTGHGMTQEVLPKIFDPYFTTKPIGKGTGLGLAVVKGLVGACGGGIEVVSEPGAGSTFDVYLPVVPAGAALRDEQASAPARSGRGERVLFVDDEKAIANVGRRMLEHHGYAVTPSTSSAHALRVFSQNPNGFDLVVTDLTMPGMTGDRLAEQMLMIRPDIPIILCTGFSDRIWEEKAAGIGIRKFMNKPVLMDDLAETIRNILGK